MAMRGIKDIVDRRCKQCGVKFSVSRNDKKIFCSRECSAKSREKNLLGMSFGNLTVINKLRCGGNGIGTIWQCRCKCGKIIEKSTGKLLNGKNQSCGCFRKKSFGLIKTAFYHKYSSMRMRCENPKSDSYNLYGGRGIECERKTFQEFYKDMYESYLEHCRKFGKEKTTLDRINSNGNYCKKNCRWATPKEQSNNKRNNRIIEFRGEKKTISQWAEEIGITYSAMMSKIIRGVPMWRIYKFPHRRRYSRYNVKYNKEKE